jgi:hypothetical protein
MDNLMATQAAVNPSEEVIRIGPLGIRFLLTGEDTNGSVSVFEVTVPAGQKLAAPAHRFDNFGTEDAKQLSVVTPAIMGPAYFREASQLVNAAAGGPPDTAKMVAIFRRHGMTIAAPPPTR